MSKSIATNHTLNNRRRDYGNKSYEVEDNVWSGRFRRHSREPDGLSPNEQRSIANQLTDHFGIERIPITRSRSTRSSAYPTEWRMVIGPYAGRATVCHEVAHIMAGPGHGHDAVWRWHYVQCVEVELGAYHANRLLTGFRKAFGDDDAIQVAEPMQGDGLDELRLSLVLVR